LIVGLAFYVGTYVGTSGALWSSSPSQLPVVAAGGIGGLVGGLLDSLLSATCRLPVNSVSQVHLHT
jgi:hypothetical protein